MSRGSDIRQQNLALTVYRMSKGGSTSKEIARVQGIDVKRVKTLKQLGERLSGIVKEQQP